MEKLFTIWFVVVVCPGILAMTLYDIFVKDNPISIIITFIMLTLFVFGVKEIRSWRKRTEKEDGEERVIMQWVIYYRHKDLGPRIYSTTFTLESDALKAWDRMPVDYPSRIPLTLIKEDIVRVSGAKFYE